ncbi:asparagine synthase-related protein [Modestobacter versicolor]|uniref:asparagine synthase-related protein n=1 Tax=Modestobacter versicolor TaxID=429133 RepID=UPI0034DE2782
MTGRPAAWQLSPLELAAGVPLGTDPTRRLPRPLPGAPGARQAFETVLLEALRRPPCVVSFSGGRDSSAVLAVAVTVARREGLPLPVAVSLRFAGVPAAEETAWQQRVVDRLGVPDWERVEVDTELDLVGPLARTQFDRHGVLWPFNTMFHAPIAERAAGGTLVTGFGGDEIMSPGWAWDRLNWVLTRQRRPRPADLLELAGAAGPRPLRRRVLARRPEPMDPPTWLLPAADAAVRDGFAALRLAEPVRHDDAVLRHWWAMRYFSVVVQSLELMAGGYGAAIVHPFADPCFLRGIAADRGRAGPRHRSRETIGLFADVLPREVLTRVGKASFNGAFWGPETQEFARTWDGSGVDDGLVDVEALRRVWHSADPDARTYPLLQAAFVDSGRSRRGQ